PTWSIRDQPRGSPLSPVAWVRAGPSRGRTRATRLTPNGSHSPWAGLMLPRTRRGSRGWGLHRVRSVIPDFQGFGQAPRARELARPRVQGVDASGILEGSGNLAQKDQPPRCQSGRDLRNVGDPQHI